MPEDTERQIDHSNRSRAEPRGHFLLGCPFWVQVLAGVVGGAMVGLLFGATPILLGFGSEQLGELGMLVIRMLKFLAVPLVFFAIVDTFLRTRISSGTAGRLLLICGTNLTVALVIGLTLMNVVKPGESLRGSLQGIVQGTGRTGTNEQAEGVHQSSKVSLSPIKALAVYIPEGPKVISAVLGAILIGAALRQLTQREDPAHADGLRSVGQVVEVIYKALLQIIEWVICTVPFAVFGIVAQVVGRAGLAPFTLLGSFVGIILLGLALHALVYYPLLAWLGGNRSPSEFLGKGADAILTGISTNSSLVTVPVTLRCLTEKLGISPDSARISACMGTNLNNDGITLYEAMAALFLAQACGFDLTMGQQLIVLGACVMAGIGVAGIPEAGLIVLPLVLGAAGLPEVVVAAAIPLLLTVDWLLARVRSGVNVMSDMLVAILLDRVKGGKGLRAE